MARTVLSLLVVLVAVATCQPHDNLVMEEPAPLPSDLTPLSTILMGSSDSSTPPPLPTIASASPAESTTPAAADPSSSLPPMDTSAASPSASPGATDVTSAGTASTTDQPAPDATSPSTSTDDVSAGSTSPSVDTEEPTSTTEATTQLPTTPNYYPSVEEIIESFKAVVKSEYYGTLSYDDRLLVLELISSGEAGQLEEMIDAIGKMRIFSFISKIPLQYFDSLMEFILANLTREQLINAMSNATQNGSS